MTDPRPHPFDLVFGEMAEVRFGAIREALGTTLDLDQWLMARPVIELLHDLRPDEGLGGAVDDFVLFVHAAYQWWHAGSHTTPRDSLAFPITVASYIQVPPRRIWARLGAEDSHEPLDGWFVFPEGDRLRVVACLGVHPARPGLSVLTAAGPPPTAWQRPDGTSRFAPQMTGGDTAGLSSIAAPEELLLLAWGVEPDGRTTDGHDGSQVGRHRD